MNDEFRSPVLSSLFGRDSAFIIPNSAFGLSRLQPACGSAALVVEDDVIVVAHVARRGPRHFPDGVVEDDGIEPVGFPPSRARRIRGPSVSKGSNAVARGSARASHPSKFSARLASLFAVKLCFTIAAETDLRLRCPLPYPDRPETHIRIWNLESATYTFRFLTFFVCGSAGWRFARVAELHRSVVWVGRGPAAGLGFKFAEPSVLLARRFIILRQAIALAGRLFG